MKVQDFICGLLAGWSQIITGQPFDYIKIIYQTEKASVNRTMS